MYRARIMGEDSQVELARRFLKSGMLIEKVVEETGVSVVGPYAVMTCESIQQERNRLYEKARRDEAQALHNRSVEISRNLLKMGLTFNQIARATGLPWEELERYK